jgi:hypothetical protein
MSYGSPVGIVISESPIAPIRADCAVCDVYLAAWKQQLLLQERMQLQEMDSDVILDGLLAGRADRAASHGGDAYVGG